MISFSLLGLLVDGGDEFLALFTRARVMCTIVAWISPDPVREIGERTQDGEALEEERMTQLKGWLGLCQETD